MSNCLWCGSHLAEHFTISKFFKPWHIERLCPQCRQLFHAYQQEACCQGCGRQSTKIYCPECQKWHIKEGEVLLQNQALFHYDAFAKDWISRYKFQGDCALAWMLVEPLKAMLKQYPDYQIVPIPTSKKSLQTRGFKAVEYPLQLAGINYENALQDIRVEKKQSEKTREERLLLEQPFEILGKITAKHVLIIDDVYTTGSTLHRAAELLKKNDAQTIKSVTFFR